LKYSTTDILALLIALALSSVAAYYSVVGLTAIFAASFWPIVIMGSTLEVAKVVTTSWLYQNWKTAPRFVRYYLTLAVVVLMFITSIGIFGYLSKAHIEQSSKSSISLVEVESIDLQITSAKNEVESARFTLKGLDSVVQTLVDAQRIRGEEGAVATREKQQPERDALNKIINSNNELIAELMKKKAELDLERSKLDAEVGPLKYVAELIYGDSETTTVEHAVRVVILTIIFVFDPLAVLLLIGANSSIIKKSGGMLDFSRKNPFSSRPVRKKTRVKTEKSVKITPKTKKMKDIGPTLPI
jgi:hypothetical protein